MAGFQNFDTCDYGVCLSCNNRRKLLVSAFVIRKDRKVPKLNFDLQKNIYACSCQRQILLKA